MEVNNITEPSVPVYYRVRRASSSVWGWIDGFSQQTKMEKHNFLAPLAQTQTDYTLDPEYETNRKVHFRIQIDNAPVSIAIPERDKCHYYYDILYSHKDSANLTIENICTSPKCGYLSMLVYINDENDKKLKSWGNEMPTAETLRVPVGSTINVLYQDDQHMWPLINTYKVIADSKFVIKDDGQGSDFNLIPDQRIANFVESKKDSLRNDLQRKYDDQSALDGRCMWDRTAKLLLQRTIEETGNVSEIIIPQDSIVRQAEGSWIAHYTDVANMACAHIHYAARIDQSGSDLHVADEAQLQPVAIHGPDLYFDEAATILSFTASQGDAVGQRKRGVVLSWMPSSAAVDEYVLTRLAKNSDQVADTIYRGADNSFFDETAVPDMKYEYAVTALYNCNGKSSANSATAEGWRSPYGEISGSIVLTDNSGMAGVKVVLQGPDGETKKTVITGAEGTFLFDSLRNDISSSTQFAIVPAHTYAIFSYNNTSAQSASVTLSADHAVASGINFMNTSTVRLTGRALYKYSTIPVAALCSRSTATLFCATELP